MNRQTLTRLAQRTFTLVMLAGAIGCGGAKPGDACDNPECKSSTIGYACDNGIYREVPCRGPLGCTAFSTDQTYIQCDESLDVAGDQCAQEDVGTVLCETDPNALTCNANEVWEAVTCPASCTEGGPGVGACM